MFKFKTFSCSCYVFLIFSQPYAYESRVSLSAGIFIQILKILTAGMKEQTLQYLFQKGSHSLLSPL